MAKAAVRRARHTNLHESRFCAAPAWFVSPTTQPVSWMASISPTAPDHLAFAGAAMGPVADPTAFLGSVFFEHLAIAIETLGRDIRTSLSWSIWLRRYKYCRPTTASRA